MPQHQDLQLLRATWSRRSQTSANRFRTARYANDQSKQPSLELHSKSAEPSQIAVGGSQDEFANPTGNSYGQLGNGSTSDPFGSASPVAVVGGHVFTDIAVGRDSTCAIATDQSMWCWGSSGAWTRTGTRFSRAATSRRSCPRSSPPADGS